MKRGILSRLLRRGKSEFEASRPWQPTVAQPTVAPQTVARPPVQHDPAMTRWVRLPLAQAVICGFFAAWLPTGIAVVVIIWTEAGGWWLAAVPATLVFSTLALSGVAWYTLFILDRKTLMFIERFIGVDLNRDGSVGEPEWIRGEVTDKDRRQRIKVEFPFPKDRLRAVAVAILRDGAAFSRRGLSNVISETQFRTLQQEFLKRGLCYWKNPESEQQGVDLSPGGRAFLRMYIG